MLPLAREPAEPSLRGRNTTNRAINVGVVYVENRLDKEEGAGVCRLPTRESLPMGYSVEKHRAVVQADGRSPTAVQANVAGRARFNAYRSPP